MDQAVKDGWIVLFLSANRLRALNHFNTKIGVLTVKTTNRGKG